MKILITGNCQARPMSELLCDGVNNFALEPIILHLAKVEDANSHEALLSDADVIIAQATSDSFQPAHLSSRFLKEQFGPRVLVWPNVFYSGQTPYLRYITHTKAGRITGPLDVYHDLRILNEWYISRMGRKLSKVDVD